MAGTHPAYRIFMRGFTAYIIVSFLISLAAGIKLHAQYLADTIRIREISVLGVKEMEGSLFNHTGMDSLSRAVSRTLTLTELLSGNSNIYIKTSGRGSLATAAFRGTDASHTSIFWNGMELNSAMNGQVDLSLVPVFFLDDIQLYHGGSSLLCGSGALGGSVVMNSKADWSEKPGGKLIQEFASFSSYNMLFRTGVTRNSWHFNTRMFYNYSKNDYSYVNRTLIPSKKDRVRDAMYKRYGLLQEGYYRLNADNILSLSLWLQQSHRRLPPLASYEGNRREEFQDDKSLRLTFGWDRYYTGGDIRFRSGFSMTELDYFLRSLRYDYINYDSENRELELSNSLEHRHRFSEKFELQSQLRLDVQDASNYEAVRKDGYHGSRTELSFMSTASRKLGKRLEAYLLLREELVDRRWLAAMPSAGFEYMLPVGHDLSLKANLSRNYKNPDLNDLYWIPGGNPDLEPEKGISTDLSLRYRRTGDGFSLSNRIGAFYADIDNWIIWMPTPYRYWTASNIRRVITRGLEWQLVAEGETGTWVYHLRSNYSLTMATNESPQGDNDLSGGRQLIYIPRHTGNLNINLAKSSWFINYQLEYSGKRYTQTGSEADAFEIILTPYMLSDLMLGKDMCVLGQQFLLQLGIRNIFDTDYQMIYSRPMPGRNYSAILEYRF